MLPDRSIHSNNHGGAPPPPRPPPAPPTVLAPASSSNPSAPSSPGVAAGPQQRRLAVPLPTLTTALVPPQQGGYLQTPVSATTLSSPFSPYATSSLASFPSPTSRGSSPLTTRPVMMAYNPQEWSQGHGHGHGHGGGAYAAYSNPAMGQTRNREMTGMEASMPSPPPPYSPNPSQPSINQNVRASPATSSSPFGVSHVRSPSGHVAGESSRASPSSTTPYAMVQHQSPIPTQAPSFPPPPPRNGRDRSSSRPKDRQHSLFSFSALTSRHRSGGGESSNSQTAIDTLRRDTSDAISRAPGPGTPTVPTQTPTTWDLPQQTNDAAPMIAPAARRAVSTGAIGVAHMPARQGPQNESPVNAQQWGRGMALPPPPPGPPPSGSRSQSMSRTTDRATPTGIEDTVRPSLRQPAFGSSLGPVPPTPAGWTEEENISRSRSPAARGLHIETGQAATSHANASTSASSSQRVAEPQTAHPTSTGLTRTPARRDPSARGIRERRSESRAERDRFREIQSAIDPPTNPWAADMQARPADLVLPPTSGAISHRRVASRTTPSSSGQRSVQLEDGSSHSNTSTPRQDSARPQAVDYSSPTPPLSASLEGGYVSGWPGKRAANHNLPSPPTQPQSAHSIDAQLAALSPDKPIKDRPYSHILSTPNEDIPMHVPLQPSRPSSSAQSRRPSQPTADELFASSAIERHKAFIAKESAAQSDKERLVLFTEFIVAESRIRRDKYSNAFDSMASEIWDSTRDMWRPLNTPGRRSTTPNAVSTPQSLQPAESLLSRSTTTEHSDTFSVGESSRQDYTPRTQSESPSSVTSTTSKGRNRAETPLLTGFQPCLSPIPSMAQSTVPDDDDSRGRTASRWWEASADGSSGRGGKVIERSKRESKYMGLPPEARQHLQWDDDGSSFGTGTPGPSQQAYGPNEYPPEKMGSFPESLPPPPPRPTSFYGHLHSAPATPDPFKLDVSRLVTLPPPYPRHYPAVNNNHPDLASIRSNLRSLGELDDVTARKDEFKERMRANREREKAGASEARNHLRHSIQERVRSNAMSFAEAAREEADFEAAQARLVTNRAQGEFDAFQREVAGPLHAIYSERITKATASIEHVRQGLFNDIEDPSPNQTQESGDEQPELLEKLTLLKWLFEMREQLHKGMFDLESERDDYYKAVILTPYKLEGNERKLREAEDFFSRDAQDRQVGFEKDTLKRVEDFMNIIEQNVTRGVEVQLSAFWDIAPNLLAVVQKIPHDLDGFEILIPPQEYEENPVYHEFPMQYLFTLLAHAGKSAYQFIESQINLLCLLHEVKSGVMLANSRLLETQQYLASEDFGGIDREMAAVREHEEARLTEDLKEKVALVEGQWGEALGKGLEECKDRVQAFLMERGGWDESDSM